MPKVSIIVPVYKAEKYIRRCLDSIQAQTLTDFEALLIDDGSPDNSGDICDEYARKDARIKVIHKQNEGVAIARQTGLDVAQGKYVIHIDSDDWAENNWLEVLYIKAEDENSDMVICDFWIHNKIKVEYSQQCPQSFKCADIVEDLICDKIWGSCWNKLVRRSCFVYYNIRFVSTMNLWEDLYVVCSLLQYPIKVSYVNIPLYNYDFFSNNCSIVRFRTVEHIQSLTTFINHFEKIYSSARYVNGWYIRKCMVKCMIYRLENSPYSLTKIYPEINKRYITENKKAVMWSEPFYISLCLKGIPVSVVKFLSKAVSFMTRLKTTINHEQ